jgi:predicted secreted hydrolase
MLMSWKEGRDLYLVILLMMGIVLVEGYLFTIGRDRQGESREGGSTLSVGDLLGSSPDDSLFARVTGPRAFVFPDDHGPHPDHRTEWWYVTGNLEGEDGGSFGIQFTLFRSALAPGSPAADSEWATHQLYLGHLAVTDVQGQRHLHRERLARGAAGLAGAGATPFRVWLEDWELASVDPASPAAPGDPDAIFPLRLRAGDEDFALDLRLEAGRGLVLQGDAGYSRKGADPSNASYYFSYPRMPASGTLRIGDRLHRVTGLTWMDREWSTSALDAEQVGWDWFALQLSTGEDLMVFQLRRRDGTLDPVNRGLLVTADGTPLTLGPDEWSLEVLDRWASPRDGVTYPSRWRLHLPRYDLDVTLTPLVADQEMLLSVRYWEGAIAVDGTGPGERPVSGRGYVELTGYAEGSSRGAGRTAAGRADHSQDPDHR